MTALEAYKALPFEQRELVEQIEYNLDIADQCFSTIKAMLPDKEVVLMMLMDMLKVCIRKCRRKKNWKRPDIVKCRF